MNFFSITTKVFLSHLLLVILLISGLSYKHYADQIEQYIQNVTQFHSASSYSIVSTCSDAMAGDNYANIQMGEFLKELQRNSKLLMMKIEGKSDYSSTPYKAYYEKSKNNIWQGYYQKNFEEITLDKIKTLESKLNDPIIDKVKINFLISRHKEILNSYKKNIQLSEEFEQNTKTIFDTKNTKINFQIKQLLITIPTDNKNGGTLQMIFDISEIDMIKSRILFNIFKESLIAFIVSLIVLTLLSSSIVRPIKKLSQYMSSDFVSLEPHKVPLKDTKDEIGILANSFANLLSQTKEYVKRLEQLSQNDPLTGLFNRRAFDDIFSHLQKQPIKKAIGTLFIDIDNFKKYNDTYGHNAGDVTLQKVAQAIEGSLQRKGDYAFRLGGEEFAVLLSVENEEQVISIAERIRKNVEKLQILHNENLPYSYVTISIGANFCEYYEGIDQHKLLQIADKSLYNAKQTGKNKVSFSSFNGNFIHKV